MHNGKRVISMSTRMSAKAVPVQSVVTVDMDGVTDEQLEQLAFRQLKVDLQAHFRAKGIPKELTINLRDHGKTGAVVIPNAVSAQTHAMALSKDEKLALIEKIRADLAANEATETESADAE